MANTTAQDIRRIVNLMESAMERPTIELTSLTDNGEREKISDAWPDGILYHGNKVFDFYLNNSDSLEKELGIDGDNGQESYLGYDPDSDRFISGYDTWPTDDSAEYYVNDEDGDHEDDRYDDFINRERNNNSDNGLEYGENAIKFQYDPKLHRIVTGDPIYTGSPMMYPGGLKALRIMFPNLIDIRLD